MAVWNVAVATTLTMITAKAERIIVLQNLHSITICSILFIVSATETIS